MTGWHIEQWNFQNNKKTMKHSDHWIMTGWHIEQWNFQNNKKTMKHSDHWIMTDSRTFKDFQVLYEPCVLPGSTKC
jgi:hypothetical protein